MALKLQRDSGLSFLNPELKNPGLKSVETQKKITVPLPGDSGMNFRAVAFA